MDHFVEEVIMSHEEIVEAAKRIGAEITEIYNGKTPIIVGLLKGCMPFMAELIKHIKCDMEIDFMDVSSYHGTESTGIIKINKDIEVDIRNRYVVLVEDIVDTGFTLQEVMGLLKSRGAISIEIVTLLNKPAGRTVKCLEPKWVGLEIDPKFVIGFGLDYNELYRNLDYVGVLKRSVYEK